MANSGERLAMVEQHLGRMTTDFKEVRKEVVGLRTDAGGLRTEVGGLRTEVDELRTEVGALREEVNTVRVLCEANADDIKKVAEVQVHHGQQLEEITRALGPLAELGAFVRVIGPDHERRIKALESQAGQRRT
jgi:archaellum component FlaC